MPSPHSRNSKIVFQVFQGKNIDTDKLSLLGTRDLRGLCILLGISKSGTKKQMVERLIACHAVRVKLSDYNTEGEAAHNSVAEMKKLYSAKDLRAMCKTVKCFLGQNKAQACLALLGWRNGCRYKGHKAVKVAREQIEAMPAPKQLVLRFAS